MIESLTKRLCLQACYPESRAFLFCLFFKLLVGEPTARKKNGFVTATKLGTTNIFFGAATKNFAAPTKRFVDRTKHFLVVTKYFCYPYFNK